jgi:uncharacterized membrane protein
MTLSVDEVSRFGQKLRCAAVVGLVIVAASMERTGTQPNKTIDAIWKRRVALFLAGYTLLFFWLACRKFALFTDNSADTSIITHGIWATLHGQLFPDYTLEMCYFGDHASYVLLTLLPIYWLVPTVPTLLFLQSLFIAASGIPMFLIARRILKSSGAAFCIMAAFLLFPTVVSQHVNTIHDTQFIIVFLLWAFYFYHMERFGLFVLFAALSCLGKENVPLTVMVFGIYALLQRRHWKWVVTPLVLGAAAMVAVFQLIMPPLRGGKPYRSFGYFGDLGKNPGEVLETLLTKPGRFFGIVLSADRILFLIQLLQPLAIMLPFFSLAVIFVAPDLLVNLVVENSSPRVIAWHYNLTVAAFLFVAAIFSIQKVAGWLESRQGKAPYAVGIGLLLLCLSASQWVLWLNPNDYRQPPQYEALHEALATVPANASVLVPQTMLAQVANRWNFSTIQHWLFYRRPTDPQRIFDYQYVIVDRNERPGRWATVPEEAVKAFAASPNHELIYNNANVVVFRRKGEDILGGKPTW